MAEAFHWQIGFDHLFLTSVDLLPYPELTLNNIWPNIRAPIQAMDIIRLVDNGSCLQ